MLIITYIGNTLNTVPLTEANVGTGPRRRLSRPVPVCRTVHRQSPEGTPSGGPGDSGTGLECGLAPFLQPRKS